MSFDFKRYTKHLHSCDWQTKGGSEPPEAISPESACFNWLIDYSYWTDMDEPSVLFNNHPDPKHPVSALFMVAAWSGDADLLRRCFLRASINGP